MKNIETLVEDIYSLFTLDPIKMDEKEVDKHIDTFGEMLKVHIKAFMYESPRTKGNLRLSQIGKSNRKLWYDINSKEKIKDIEPSTRIKFLYGYILEELLLLCASIAGHKVTDQQKEVSVGGVLGHQDAMIDDVLVARCLGQYAEQISIIFKLIWSTLRPEVSGRDACHPRIWST